MTWALWIILAAFISAWLLGWWRGQQAERATAPEGEIIEVGGTPVHIKIAGQGPDIVLIHGANGNLRDFTFSLSKKLQDRYRVIMFDRPGLGYTGRPNGLFSKGETPQEQARLLQAAARQKGVENPIVVGYSFGGAVALAWALENPDDPAAVVLLSGVSMPWDVSLGLFYRLVGTGFGSIFLVPFLSALAPNSVIKQSIDGTFAPQTPPAGYVDHLGGALALRPITMRANTRQVNELLPHIVQQSTRYDELTMPIELIHGTSDDTVPAETHAIPFSQVVETAHLTLLDGVGHMPHHTNPDDVIAAIDRAAQRAGLRNGPQDGITD